MFTLLSKNRKLASRLTQNRNIFGAAIYEAFGSLDDWQLLTHQPTMDRQAIIEHMICPEIDFLAMHLRTGYEAFYWLFAGAQLRFINNKAKVAALCTLSAAEYTMRYRSAMLAVAKGVCNFDAGEQRRLDEALLRGFAGIDTPVTKTLKILFIGDCLFDEVTLFLGALAIAHGWHIVSEHILSKNPVEQRRSLSSLDPASYQMVVFSPFSYEFAQEYRQVLLMRHALISSCQLVDLVISTQQETQKTLDLLADRFDAPIFVHNSSTLQRGSNLIRLAVKILTTQRTRRRAKRLVNGWLTDYVAAKNRESFKHLFIFDEDALVDSFGKALKLGAYYSQLEAIHPTHFSEAVSRELMAAVEVRLRLASKKVVVCDLDNTLWAGVIGEGNGVSHYLDRQQILRDLKDKGVVLAINSKNDPANISWDGGMLKADDFVASQISWSPKVLGMKHIQSDLNLKFKDFVFIDDRADECALMREAYPEMVVLGATNPRTWRLLRLWSEQLDEPDMDRTQMYKERKKRDELIKVDPQNNEDPSAMFCRLQLKVRLAKASKADLKRITELINRTNQWNTTGARVTLREVRDWYDASDYTIYTVQLADRFGDMGMICTAVIHKTSDTLEVPLFVLSCRVFGYGIESVLLDHIKRESYEMFGAVRVKGFFRATAHNAPAASMFQNHGFHQGDTDTWLCHCESLVELAPAWLEITALPASDLGHRSKTTCSV